MIDRPEVVVLTGSSRFVREYAEQARRLTLEGKIVLPIGVFRHDPQEHLSDEQHEALDELQLRKIDLSDSLFVINAEGYIGSSTRKDIDYAEGLGKRVEYYR